MQKKKYQKPEITDQGPVVTKTKATQCGGIWDGSPIRDDDTYEPHEIEPS